MKPITIPEILNKIKNKKIIYITTINESFEYSELYSKNFPEKIKKLNHGIIHVGLYKSKTNETLYEKYQLKP